MDALQRALHFTAYPHFKVFLLAWLAGAILVPVLIRISPALGAVDKPSGYKAHAAPTPFLGGAGIFIPFVLAIAFTINLVPDGTRLADFAFGEGRQLTAIALGAALIGGVGLIDDFRPVSALWKLGLLLAVAVWLFAWGVRLDTFVWQPLNLALSILWIAGLASATNSLDHADGACAGTAAVSSLFLFLFAWDPAMPQPWLAYLALALLGSSLGFLQHNFFFRPAQIFLGNHGSLVIGFLLAALTILGNWSADLVKALTVPALLVGVPLYDIALATVLRYKNGVVNSWQEAVIYNGRDHTAHRLAALGFPPRKAVLLLWLLGAVMGALACASKRMDAATYRWALGILLAGLVALGAWLDRAPVYKPK